jgi:purine-binding chemotaxis protein CheW
MGRERNQLTAASRADEEIMARRAEALARDARSEEQKDEGDLVQVLGIGDERYALELQFIWEIFPYRPVTPVPGLPPMVRGVINFRGEIIPLYDLAALVSGQTVKSAPTGACVVLGRERIEFAVAVDLVEPPVRIANADLRSSLSRPGDRNFAYIRGFTPAGAIVLNAGAMLGDEALIIDLSV